MELAPFHDVCTTPPSVRPAHPPPRARWPAVAATTALALFVAGAVWTLTVARRTRHVPPAEAHEAYLKGRYFLDQRSIQGWRQALEQFERAVALDSQDPAAQAGLADTYSAMPDFGVASPAELRPRAMRSARRALELDRTRAAAEPALVSGLHDARLGLGNGQPDAAFAADREGLRLGGVSAESLRGRRPGPAPSGEGRTAPSSGGPRWRSAAAASPGRGSSPTCRRPAAATGAGTCWWELRRWRSSTARRGR